MDIDYPWVAQDIDLACIVLKEHVKSEFEKRRKAEDKKLNPERPASTGKSRASRTPTKHKSVTEEKLNELWIETTREIIEGKLVFHINSLDKKTAAPAKATAAAGKAAPRRVSADAVKAEQAVTGGPVARWRVEKPITGDKDIDKSADKGARVVLDEHGRKRAVFNAAGKRVFHWAPAKA